MCAGAGCTQGREGRSAVPVTAGCSVESDAVVAVFARALTTFSQSDARGRFGWSADAARKAAGGTAGGVDDTGTWEGFGTGTTGLCVCSVYVFTAPLTDVLIRSASPSVSLPDASVCCIGVCARNITHKLVQREAALWRNRSSGPGARRAPIWAASAVVASVVQLVPDAPF